MQEKIILNNLKMSAENKDCASLFNRKIQAGKNVYKSTLFYLTGGKIFCIYIVYLCTRRKKKRIMNKEHRFLI